jgi:negative regulator of replication initiation
MPDPEASTEAGGRHSVNTTTVAVTHEATSTEAADQTTTERRRAMVGRAALARALRAYFAANEAALLAEKAKEIKGQDHQATSTETTDQTITERRRAVVGRAALARALRAYFAANEAALLASSSVTNGLLTAA